MTDKNQKARELAATFPEKLFEGFSDLMERAKKRGDIQEVAYVKSLRDLFAEVVRAYVDCPMERQTTSAGCAQILERIASEPPVNGNELAQARVLMAAAQLRGA